MEHVNVLFADESIHLDHPRIKELEKLLGSETAEEMTVRAMEEIAIRLTKCERFFAQGNFAALQAAATSMVKISEQIGMLSLASAAANAVDAVSGKQPAAVAATYARLLRVGDRSLSDYWDLQEVSG